MTSGTKLIAGEVTVNQFVRRQTKESPYSYYDGDLDALAGALTEYLWKAPESVRAGYRDGVVLVDFPANRFFASTIEVNEDTRLTATYEARQPAEEQHVTVRALDGKKQEAKRVDIVLYRRDVLEPQERSPAALGGFSEWEIISINARVNDEPEPMHPLTMARNFLSKKGGTAADYTGQQFAEAIWFWSQHALLGDINHASKTDMDADLAHGELDELNVPRSIPSNMHPRAQLRLSLYGRLSRLRAEIEAAEAEELSACQS